VKQQLRTNLVFLATIALSSFLLFQVQPLIARFILPWFGGVASVWTVCMLFFQSVLLAGYAYAHLTVRLLPGRGQAILHMALLGLSLLVLPIIPADAWKPTGAEMPSLHILGLLLVVVGAPFLLLSSTAPLVQAWFARLRPGSSPYRLYALSNAGSLLGLLSYPFLFEPALKLPDQAHLWSGAYVAFAMLSAAGAWLVGRTAGAPAPESPAAISDGERSPGVLNYALWFGLAGLGSTTLLAVTNELCQEVAVVPFLWVLPLALYLVTFILCFESDRWYRRAVFFPLALLVPFVATTTTWGGADGKGAQLLYDIGFWCVAMFVLCMVCHGELVRRRPSPRHLTAFYLMISAGGAAGGVFVGLIAPRAFSDFLELPVTVFGCVLLVCAALLLSWRPFFPLSMARAGRLGLVLVALLATYLAWHPLFSSGYEDWVDEVAVSRNFYGLLRVEDTEYEYATVRFLRHGWEIHGSQAIAGMSRRIPTTYYGAGSGLALALESIRERSDWRIGAIGLGPGTLAAYGEEGDLFRIYEINPTVMELAREHFTFLSDSPAQVEIIEGDARLSMEREEPQGYDLILLDAFRGDTIPTHLLTVEAFAVYTKHLAPDGILAVHTSNDFFDLRPVVWAAADELDLASALIHADGDDELVFWTHYILLSRDAGVLESPAIRPATTRRDRSITPKLWTDDYSSLFSLTSF